MIDVVPQHFRLVIGGLSMSQWDERIRDRAVWQQMSSLGPAIDQAIPISHLDAVALAGLERVRAALAFIGKRLAAADALISFPRPLTPLHLNSGRRRTQLRHSLVAGMLPELLTPTHQLTRP
jgi:hypothetical protein